MQLVRVAVNSRTPTIRYIQLASLITGILTPGDSNALDVQKQIR